MTIQAIKCLSKKNAYTVFLHSLSIAHILAICYSVYHNYVMLIVIQ